MRDRSVLYERLKKGESFPTREHFHAKTDFHQEAEAAFDFSLVLASDFLHYEIDPDQVKHVAGVCAHRVLSAYVSEPCQSCTAFLITGKRPP